MSQFQGTHGAGPVSVENPQGGSPVVLVCEHASDFIPEQFEGLGLSSEAQKSHAAWDIGALTVARGLSKRLDAALVSGGVSRLVFDFNRPPSAKDAMPARSEIFEIPGNSGLTQAEREARTAAYYTPFRAALADQIASTKAPVLVTIHSFTPVYHGQERLVEIGVLHDRDSRFADAMLLTAQRHTPLRIERNQPYGPENGVTHTLIEHGLEPGHLNVMLEVRNDLIDTPERIEAMTEMLAAWLADALDATKSREDAQWSA